MVPRLLLKGALLVHQSKDGGLRSDNSGSSIFLPGLTRQILHTPPGMIGRGSNSEGTEVLSSLSSCLGRALDCIYEHSLDACSGLLDTVDSTVVVRQALAAIAEVFVRYN